MGPHVIRHEQRAIQPTRRAFTTPDESSSEDLQTEIAAMQAVGSALSALDDAQARLRVLRWALERFQIALGKVSPGAAAPVPVAAPAAASESDPDLDVEGIVEMFDASATAGNGHRRSAQSEPEVDTPELDTLVEGFAADFRRLTSDLQQT
jgi:hypothetical protein